MNRNYGIDFLRILSMFMVVVLHILGHGGVLAAAEPNSLKYWIVWFLEISCYCAVDCFALISGYVMWRSNATVSKALNLWLQTFFYTASILVLFLILKPEVIGLRRIADAIFPSRVNITGILAPISVCWFYLLCLMLLLPMLRKKFLCALYF